MTAACANIGPRERLLRVIGAILGGVISIGLAAFFVVADVHWAWRASLFLPLLFTAVCIFQVRAHT
jgi:CBS-domain-containing membrane protein